MDKKIIFRAENMKKYFGATHANDNVSIALPKGHIRGLIGENGSGKSTLISMIAGIREKDSGTMYLNGKSYEPKNSLDAGKNGIGTVVQELGLVDGLPVGMNLFLGRTEKFEKMRILDINALYKKAEAVFKEWGFSDISVKQLTGTLSVEQKKVVELVRALSFHPDLLILDEITQALSLNNREKLIGIISQLKKRGKAILLVTHDIEEMVAITDVITIMRDGKIVAERDSDKTTPDEIKRLMVGRDLNGTYYREDKEPSYGEEIKLSAVQLCEEHFHNISFELHKGEILGICGLSDSGIHELAEALFAVRKIDSGCVKLPKKNITINTPKQAMDMNMGYVPKDRDKQALMVNDSIENNVSLAAVELVKEHFGFLSPGKRSELSGKVIERLMIKTKGPNQIISGLSGGNRQKVNLGRWIVQNKDILILDCPTRGVDIGVKSYIYEMMIDSKKRGISIVLISDELPEIIGMCDRLMIMKDGEVVKTLERSTGLTEEAIIEVMI